MECRVDFSPDVQFRIQGLSQKDILRNDHAVIRAWAMTFLLCPCHPTNQINFEVFLKCRLSLAGQKDASIICSSDQFQVGWEENAPISIRLEIHEVFAGSRAQARLREPMSRVLYFPSWRLWVLKA